MAEARRINKVHRSLSRPLTILGAERKLFFFAMCLGAATFNLLGQLARRAADVPAALLRGALGDPDRSADSAVSAHRGAACAREYDPMKFTPIVVRREGHVQA